MLFSLVPNNSMIRHTGVFPGTVPLYVEVLLYIEAYRQSIQIRSGISTTYLPVIHE
jgi:hypothetical protein